MKQEHVIHTKDKKAVRRTVLSGLLEMLPPRLEVLKIPAEKSITLNF